MKDITADDNTADTVTQTTQSSTVSPEGIEDTAASGCERNVEEIAAPEDLDSVEFEDWDADTWYAVANQFERFPQAPQMEREPIVAWLPEEDEEIRIRGASLRMSLALITIGALVIFGSLFWVAVTRSDDQQVSGPIEASHNSHRVEGVSHNASAGPVRFLLQVRGVPLVTDVLANQDCVRTRIVQGNTASPWFSRSSSFGKHTAGVQILPFQPAYLEVRIDPSSHDPGGDDVLDHNVLVHTAEGQTLVFDVVTSGK